MKRTLATLGAVGLAALAVAAPAAADNNNKSFCHANGHGYLSISIAEPGFNGHEKHGDDIIPSSAELPDGRNWDAVGKAIFENGCAVPAKPPVIVDQPGTPPVTPPDATPPAEKPPVGAPPVVELSPAETPAAHTPAVESPAAVPAQPAPAQQAATLPKAAPKAAAQPAQSAPAVQPAQPAQPAPKAAPVPVSVGTNQGYNAQTAVGASDSGPGWLAGAGALAAAGAAVAVRRRSRPVTNAG